MYDHPIHTVLCAVDDATTTAPLLVRRAADFAQLVDAEQFVLFTVAHPVSDLAFDGPIQETTEHAVARALARLRELELRVEPAPFRFKVHASVGEPCQEIRRAASEFHADLVILEATRCDGERPPLLRSVAENVVRESDRPVLVLHVA